MKIIVSVLLLSAPQAYAKDYCVAIRGNGENAAAHWAGLARMVEEQGMPAGAAGGSSATVSMFFLDSIAGNPAVTAEKNAKKKRQMQALLLKSLPQFVTTMGERDNIAGAYNFIGELSKNKSDLKASAAKVFEGAGKLDSKQVKKAFHKYGPLVNPEMLQGLAKSPNFFRKEAQEGLAVFGKFDASKDEKLFFRPGLVDFKSFSVILGTIADFYAGNTDPKTQRALDAYTRRCAGDSFGKAWQKSREACKKRFEKIVGDYLDRGKFQNKALFSPVGNHISALPTTSLVKGEGMAKYEELKAAYNNGEKRDYGKFSVNFDRDVEFGYWGKKRDLARADRGLESDRRAGDLKAQKFKALGGANWFEVLAVSPAEPGLANLQAIPQKTSREQVLAELKKPVLDRWKGLNYRSDMLSAGGWSDLAPVGVLKAMGCNSVTYLTRKGGDTIFGQQVLIKLAGDKENVPFWMNIKDQNAEGWNTAGTAAEKTAWNRLSNRGNLNSSLQNSMRKADSFYCTDWDAYEVFGGQMWPMVDEAYAAGLNSRKTEAGCHGMKLPQAEAVAEDVMEKSAL
ncbi:MAG: hypothetical protein AB7K68_11390 [Bacteriovoracia bacterium]